MKDRKLRVVGVDGATLDLIEPWVKEGKLPVMAEIMANGVFGELRSAIPAISSPCWSSFITGNNPGKHGIFDFTQHKLGSYQVRFINASHRRSKSLWRILSDAGKRVGVVNVPITFPPEKVNGFMISGMDSPNVNSGFTYPDNLYKELENNVGQYVIAPNLWPLIGKGRVEEAIHNLDFSIQQRFKAMNYLMEKYPADFYMIVFTATDRAQHIFWKYMDPRHPLYSIDGAEKYGSVILEIYQEIDNYIGKLMDKMGDKATTIIMSDHGAGYMSHKTLYLNNWLREKGLLYYKDADSTGPKALSSLKRILYTNLSTRLPRNLWQRIPKDIKFNLKRFESFYKFRNLMVSQFFYSRIDMGRTKAYAEESRGFIWINLKGRDPLGTVEPGEQYAKLCKHIQKELQSLRDPDTQEPIIDKIYRKDEVYHGAEVHKAPDLVLVFKDGDYVLRPSYYTNENVVIKFLSRVELEKMEKNLHCNSRHLPNGVFMMKGQEVKTGARVGGAEIIDLAPTILYLMGVPVPNDIDGKILTQCLQPDFVAKNPLKFSHEDETPSETKEEEYSEEDADIIRKRLSSLGYLD